MYQTRDIDGYTVNLITSKNGRHVRSATVLVGPENQPGWRIKDGPHARFRRREAKRVIMAALGLDAKHVGVAARYSALVVMPSGMIERRNAAGEVIGAYEP